MRKPSPSVKGSWVAEDESDPFGFSADRPEVDLQFHGRSIQHHQPTLTSEQSGCLLERWSW
jgi:hypothetical protein